MFSCSREFFELLNYLMDKTFGLCFFFIFLLCSRKPRYDNATAILTFQTITIQHGSHNTKLCFNWLKYLKRKWESDLFPLRALAIMICKMIHYRLNNKHTWLSIYLGFKRCQNKYIPPQRSSSTNKCFVVITTGFTIMGILYTFWYKNFGPGSHETHWQRRN